MDILDELGMPKRPTKDEQLRIAAFEFAIKCPVGADYETTLIRAEKIFQWLKDKDNATSDKV